MHNGMQTPPQMQQQSHFIVDHRARPEDAAVHITVSLSQINNMLACQCLNYEKFYHYWFSSSIKIIRNLGDMIWSTSTPTITEFLTISLLSTCIRFRIRFSTRMD